MKVVVPVTSLCPCSKKISDYGAHNQRSHVTITAETQGFVWIEDLVRVAEEQASCELYGLLKRPDEKYVTERAYDNPKFVEDMVRDVAAVLNHDERIEAYVVESENFESIHNHSAYALIERDKRHAEAAPSQPSRAEPEGIGALTSSGLAGEQRFAVSAGQNRCIIVRVWPSCFISSRLRKLMPSSTKGMSEFSCTDAVDVVHRDVADPRPCRASPGRRSPRRWRCCSTPRSPFR